MPFATSHQRLTNVNALPNALKLMLISLLGFSLFSCANSGSIRAPLQSDGVASSVIQHNARLALQICGKGEVKSVNETDFTCADSSENQTPIHKKGWVKPVDYVYPNKDTIKLISWNVEHFVDKFDDPYVDNRRENSAQHMGNKRADLVSALQQADADIVVLQEFESAKLLRDIAENDLADMGYQFFADAPSHTWYMNVVIMSRVPLGVMYSYGNLHTPLVDWLDEDGKPSSQSRLNTRTWSIDVYPSQNYSFVLSAVHLKAGRGDRDVAMRIGQINMLKAQYERFLSEQPNRNIMLVGDFNALPNTKELNAITQGTNAGNTFINPLADDVYTHTALEPQRRLDYIVYNQNMAAEIVPNSVTPVTFFAPEQQDALADHLPVVVEIITTEKN